MGKGLQDHQVQPQPDLLSPNIKPRPLVPHPRLLQGVESSRDGDSTTSLGSPVQLDQHLHEEIIFLGLQDFYFLAFPAKIEFAFPASYILSFD